MKRIFSKVTENLNFTGIHREDSRLLLEQHGCDETVEHSYQVAEECRRLAKQYDLDAEQAELAGLYHDISAVYPNSARLEVSRELGLEIVECEEALPLLLHQKISREMARTIFGVTDNNILNAIACHTTLRPDYTEYDLTLFIADKIRWDQPGEPPYLDKVVNGLRHSLEEAAYQYIDHIYPQVKYIHPLLEESYAKLKQVLDK